MPRSTIDKIAAEIQKQLGLFRVPINEVRWVIISSVCGHSHNNGSVCVALMPNTNDGFVVGRSLPEALELRTKLARLFAQEVVSNPDTTYAFKCSEMHPHEWEDTHKNSF